jgi:hypothetical protein
VPASTFFPASHGIRGAVRQNAAQKDPDFVFGRTRDDVARRTLQHRDVRCAFGHGGDERDRRRTATDDYDALAGEVEILRPLLRVHDRSAKAFDAGPLRCVAAVVIVVASAEIEEVAGELDDLFDWSILCIFPVSTSTVHRVSSDDHVARRTRWL